jgi:predicted dehydrogenase
MVAGCAKNQNQQAATEEAPAIGNGKLAPASGRMRIAVAGVRGRGESHVEAFAGMKDVEVAYICDVDTGVAEPLMRYVEQKQGKRPIFVQDYRRVLADRSVDAVSLATPNHWHALQTIWACQAGKDVYVEKPVSHNVWEGRKMVEAARKYGKIVQTGTQSRSSSAIKEGIKYVREGKLGKVMYAQGLCYKRRKSIGHYDDEPLPPVGVDYNTWLGPAPVRPFNKNRFHYDWHWNWDYGNGDLGNQGIHQMDICRWAIGKKELPAKVVSFGGRFGYEDDGQTPNTQVAWLDYGDAKILFEVRGLETKGYLKHNMVAVVVHCENGYLEIGGPVWARTWNMEPIQEFKGQPNTPSHFRNFAEAAMSGQQSKLAADIEEGHVSSALCHVANISYRLGSERPLSSDNPVNGNKVVNDAFSRMRDHLEQNDVDVDQTNYRLGKTLLVDQRTERFFKDDKANELTTREYRQPFDVPEYV